MFRRIKNTRAWNQVAMDRYGNVRTAVVDSVRLSVVSGPTATFSAQTALSGGVASMQATYDGGGTSVLQATGRNVRGQQTVTVGGGSVAAYAGDLQAAMAGTALPTRPAVRVLDAGGNPVAGRLVTFSVSSGGGSVTGSAVMTDALGVAAVGSWTLGATADLNTLTATVSGTGITSNPVQFSAAGCEGGGGSGYAVTLCYASTLTASQRSTFQTASAKWSSVVSGDLPDVTATIPSGACAAGSPGLSMTMDDLVIFSKVAPIDGPGAVLGYAGWCYRRTAGLCIIGIMQFDVADVPGLEASGQFSPVILHEMGHLLGVGTLWNAFGLLQSPSSAGSPAGHLLQRGQRHRGVQQRRRVHLHGRAEGAGGEHGRLWHHQRALARVGAGQRADDRLPEQRGSQPHEPAHGAVAFRHRVHGEHGGGGCLLPHPLGAGGGRGGRPGAAHGERRLHRTALHHRPAGRFSRTVY